MVLLVLGLLRGFSLPEYQEVVGVVFVHLAVHPFPVIPDPLQVHPLASEGLHCEMVTRALYNSYIILHAAQIDIPSSTRYMWHACVSIVTACKGTL